MSEPHDREPLNYESRVGDDAFSIIPDPRSSWPFVKGVLLGTPSTPIALLLTLLVVDPVFRLIPALSPLTQDQFMAPAPTHWAGVLVMDIVLKTLIVVCFAQPPFRSSFSSGVVFSILTSYGSCCGLTALLAKFVPDMRV